MYVRLCVHYTGNAVVGPSMCSFMRTNSLLHCSIFEEFDVLIDNNSHYYMYLENRRHVF